MAVTGTFAADFSQFNAAVQESQGKLLQFEGAGKQVETALQAMTRSQEEMLNKIGASGGRIQELGATAGTTGGQVKTLSDSYRQFDGLLQSAGINIGPQVKGLEDIANAAGKTAEQLGFIGTAGAIAGAALAGIKVGQWIDSWSGLSTAIENATNALMGWETVITKAEGEQMIINKALEEGAKRGLDYKESLKFLEEQQKKNADAQINWRGVLGDTIREVNNLSDAQKTEIAIAQEAGATVEQITNKYGISAGALDLLTKKTDEAAAASARLTAEKEREAAALEKAYAKLMSDVTNANQLAIMEADAAKIKIENDQKKWESTAKVRDAILASAKASGEAANFEKALVVEQANLDKSNEELIASFSTMTEAHVEAGAAAQAGTAQTVAGYQAVQQQVEITSDGVKGWLELMAATNRANAILKENSLFTTSGQLERIAAGNLGGTLGAFAPSFASGVSNFGGGLAKVHGGEVLANLPPGTSVFPRGQGLGANISNVFNLVDSESNLARKVSELIMRQVRAGTQLGTA